ncbi:MAG: hypothetical protein Q7N87_02355 [Candidatus Uhrbacteria bacterium]|nr:hypothetical protein [Candidatus Uhrbacteria bacterium]
METIGDLEEMDFFPPMTGEPAPFGVMAFRRMLEGIRVPKERSCINSPGWIGDIQLIDYKRVWVEVEFADGDATNFDAFDPFETLPHADDQGREEAFLLNPFGKPIGYVKPWEGDLAEESENPMDRILALKVPKLLKYVLWYREGKYGKRRAGLFIIEGNKPFEKMIEVYKSIDPAFCGRLRKFIAERNRSSK